MSTKHATAAIKAGDDPASSLVESLNGDWFILDENGTMYVCRFLEEEFPGNSRRRVMIHYSFIDFRRKLETRTVVLGGREVSVGEAWLRWSGRRQYDRAVFDPTSTSAPPGVLNLFQGWAMRPLPGDWSLIRQHIEQIICGGDAPSAAYLFGWMADMFQHPEKMPGVAPVLRGKEGSGKSILGFILRRMTGQHGMLVKDPRHVVGNFNAHLRDLIFLEAGEAMFAGDRRDGDRLKALVTDEVIAIEKKGVNAYQAPSRLHILMTTNADWAVPAGPESRRYLVLDVSQERIRDHSYWDRLWAAAHDDGVVGAMLRDLLMMDLSEFNVRKVPVTNALLDQRARSATGVVAWALDLAEREEFIDGDGDVIPWTDFISTTALYGDYVRWAKARRFESTLATNLFGKDLQEKLGLVQRRPREGAVRPRGYVVGTLQEFTHRAQVAAGLAGRSGMADPYPGHGNASPERPGPPGPGGPGSSVAPRDEGDVAREEASLLSSSTTTRTTRTTLTKAHFNGVSVARDRSGLDRPGTVLDYLQTHPSANVPILVRETGLPESEVQAELSRLKTVETGGFHRLPGSPG